MNTVHNIDFLNNDLPDKCANLIIADPPYFEVKGDFDFIWDSFDDYLKDVEKWAIECKRILADNGTLFWYGSAKNIAYAQIIFDKHFNLINNLVWNKGSFMGLEESEGLRSFAPCTERILMYANEEAVNKATLIHKDYFKSVINKIQETAKFENFVNCLLNLKIASSKDSAKVLASYKLGKHKTRFDLLSKEMYDFIGGFNYSFNELENEYKTLKNEYKELRRPFNNRFNLQEVLNFSNEQAKTGSKYDHDTVKPETLTRALILTCSRENDLVVVPFAGSGTECAMSAKEKRRFVGYEITEKHANMAQDRANKILKEPTLF